MRLWPEQCIVNGSLCHQGVTLCWIASSIRTQMAGTDKHAFDAQLKVAMMCCVMLLQGITTAIAYQHGMGSSAFALAVALSSIVMYDAAGVRRHAGRQAEGEPGWQAPTHLKPAVVQHTSCAHKAAWGTLLPSPASVVVATYMAAESTTAATAPASVACLQDRQQGSVETHLLLQCWWKPPLQSSWLTSSRTCLSSCPLTRVSLQASRLRC